MCRHVASIQPKGCVSSLVHHISSSAAGCALASIHKRGSESLEAIAMYCLGKGIGKVVLACNVFNGNLPSCNAVSDEVMPDVDVFRPTVELRVMRECDCCGIVDI